jgi:hypothetical protein
MPIGTPQGNLDIKNATLRTSNLETQNIKIGSIFVGTGVYSLEETANVGNSMSNTIQFTNTHTGFVTTSNVGIGTNTPLDTLHINGGTLFAGHIIPTTNATFDIGSAEKKVRDLYVDTNSLWVGDTTKIAFSSGKMKFKRRKVNQVPRMLVTLATSQSNELSTESEVQSDAVTFAQTIDASISTVSDLRLEHWRDYAKTFDTTKTVSDIFADNDDDYEAVTASEAFIEVGSNIFTEHSLSIGKTTDPTATLDIYKEDTTAAGQTVISSITGVFSGSDATGGNINNTGLFIDLDSSATGGTATTGEEHRVWGINVDIDVTGDSDDIKGGKFLVRSELAENVSDRNTNIYGIDAQGQHNGSAPNANIIGVFGRSFKATSSTGLTDRMIGVDARYEINAGTCTDAYGVRARFDRDGGAVSNSYIFYGEHIGSTTTITNNYGIYVTGADKHYLEGNVGIGTTSPQGNLHISSGTSGDCVMILQADTDNNNEGDNPRIEFWQDGSQQESAIVQTDNSLNLMNSVTTLGGIKFHTGTATGYTNAVERMIIDSTGNVGIGTTNPGTALDVNGTVTATSFTGIQVSDVPTLNQDTTGNAGSATNVRVDRNDTGDTSMYITMVNNATAGNSKRLYMDNGLVYDNTNNELKLNSLQITDYIYHKGNTGTYFGFDADDHFRIVEDGGNRFQVDSNGRIGIGTSSPQQKLEVHGNILLGQNDIDSFIHGGGNTAFSSDADILIVSDSNDTGGDGASDIIFGAGSAINMNTSRNFTYAQAYPSGVPRLEHMRILGSNGNVGIGTTIPGTLGTHTYSGASRRILHLMGWMYYGDLSGDNETWVTGIGTSSTGNANHYLWRFSLNGAALYNVACIKYTDGTYNDLITFTGQHRAARIENIPPKDAHTYEGLIVVADKNAYESVNGEKRRGKEAITANEAVPFLTLSKKVRDKTCFGVISASEDPDKREQRFGNFVSIHPKEGGDTFIFVNSLGEGAMWVSNVNGALESGDFITTSDVPGYGMKQDDDILHNYTVAKITMDCDFNPPTQPVQRVKKKLGEVKYWVQTKYINVTHEEYDTLDETERTIEYIDSNPIYKKIVKEDSLEEDDDHTELDIRMEMVNDVDENGQMIWEDHPTETEKAYKLRYLDADGNITDEVNHVHKAAFVGCTYHCG